MLVPAVLVLWALAFRCPLQSALCPAPALRSPNPTQPTSVQSLHCSARLLPTTVCPASFFNNALKGHRSTSFTTLIFKAPTQEH